MNFKSKNLLVLFALAAITSLCLSSCEKYECADEKADYGDVCDDGDASTANDIIQTDCTCSGVTNAAVLSGNITSDMTLSADMDYILSGRVIVTGGATLTIEAGTIIKAESQPNENASVLLIATDGRIQANGTASAPIIFTSVDDNIERGQITGTSLGEGNTGSWGGVIILGLAPISPETGTTARIEGVPGDVVEAEYGGNEAQHNSGSFQFVSIRHGGIALSSGNEINGLTLGGVGSGTTIYNVEVVCNNDDGIECFGGTVNVNNAAVIYQGDDAFDIDQSYAGKIENILFVGSSVNTSDNILEIDGPEGSENADGSFIVRKGSFTGYCDEYAVLKSGAQGDVQNLYYFGAQADGVDFNIDGGDATANFLSGVLDVAGCAFNDTRTLEDISMTDQTADTDAVDAKFADATYLNEITSTPSVGADITAFTGWTWADANGLLTQFQ